MKTPALITKVLTEYSRYLTGAVVVIIFIAGYSLVLAPKLSDVQTGQVKVQQKAEADLVIKKAQSIDLAKSNEAFNVALPLNQRQVIDEFLPSESDFPGLILTIKEIVQAAQLTLSSISIGSGGQISATAGAATPSTTAKSTTTPNAASATVSGVNVLTQDATINVTGGASYQSLKKLLATIESSRRLFDVISLSFTTDPLITATNSTTSSNSWTLVLRSYYLPSK